MAGLRERQKAARYRSILKAASSLFRHNGFAATNIEQIAEMAESSGKFLPFQCRVVCRLKQSHAVAQDAIVGRGQWMTHLEMITFVLL